MTVVAVAPGSAPRHLLALADPSPARVASYLDGSTVFVGEESGCAIAVAVVKSAGDEVELLNLAVAETWQARGLGGLMLAHVLEHVRAIAAGRVVVGTGNSSLRALAFYQKNGFMVIGVRRDFFAQDDPPIFENGTRCLDMIRLARDVTQGGFRKCK